MKFWRRFAASVLLVAFAATASAATFSIRSTDSAGEGLNDPAPFVPVGSNNATTLGQARMNVLLEAARVWGLLLQSNVPILVDAAFDPQTCSATSGTLGSAGPRSVIRNFGGGVSPDIFYVSALADALAGSNQSSSPSNADIGATFNSSVDSDSACLGGRGFYYGLDHNHGNKFDLLLVMLHEFGHGLGFTSQVNMTTGSGFVGSDSIERFDSYTHAVFDEHFNKAWPALSDAERVQSTTHTGNLAWNGVNVNAQAGRFTQGVTVNSRIRLYAPATFASGSSVSHFDSALVPNVLMEPNLPLSITTSSVDITVCALQDIGWTVTVCPHDASNRPPIANAQSVTVAEDASIIITLTGSDPDNNPLTFDIATQPTLGSLSAISSTLPRTVTYTPNANANGSDSFTFIVNDGTLSSPAATVSINIAPANDAPTVQDISVTAQSGQSTNIVLLANDVDGDPLIYSVVANPAHGSLSGSGPTLAYKSTNGYVGSDSFTYRVNDGTVSSAIATVTISVLNAPPTVTATSSGGGGGGAITYQWMILITLIALWHAAFGRARIAATRKLLNKSADARHAKVYRHRSSAVRVG